jgi:hypothetical protein
MRVLRTLVAVAFLLLPVIAVAGFLAYFEWMAPVVPGKVVDKQQRIIGARHAAPGRYLSTSFDLKDATEQDRYLYGSPLTTDIAVDAQTFAAQRVGASVNVKYLPFNPRTARLAGQPLIPQSLWMLAAAAAMAVLVLLFRRTRPVAASSLVLTCAVLYATPGPPSGRSALAAAAALAAVAAVAAIVKRGSPRVLLTAWAVATAAVVAWPSVRGGQASSTTATAEIRDVREFLTPRSTRARTWSITLQQFDRVHAAFVPQRSAEPVFLLDFVDHGSVGGLSEGAKVSVAYNSDTPEAARLVEGTRTHYWKNAAVPVGAALAAAWLFTRTSKSGRTRRTKQHAAAAAIAAERS